MKEQAVPYIMGVFMIFMGLITPWALEEYINIPRWGYLTMMVVFILSGIIWIILALTGQLAK